MKKIYILLVSFICSVFCMVGLDLYVRNSLDQDMEKAMYDNNIHTRNCSDYVTDQILDEKSIVVLGSSELGASDTLAYPPALFKRGNSDFNMVLMGAGYIQSVPQAVNVGALQNNIKNGKVVLILSPQWFSSSGLSSESYCSRFEEANFIEFLRNENISQKTRIAVADRMNELLAADPTTLMRAKQYETIYLYHTLNPVTYIKMAVYSAFRDAKTRYEFMGELNKLPPVDTNDPIYVEGLNFDSLLPKAEEQGEIACTNNEFGVYDSYFNQYMRENIETSRDSNINASYATSPEYGDFRLFLDVCKETGIEPMVISVPVNGRWYDYTGFPKADRNTYYQNIRDICAEYGVRLIDFSDKEYEIYYLRDIMHMGWKGWVYVDKAVYSFYGDKEYKDNTTYEELLPDEGSVSSGTTATDAGKYLFAADTVDSTFNEVAVTVVENNALLDRTTGTGSRSGVYLHNTDSGDYTVRFKADSDRRDEYVQFNVYLEKGCVYKVGYEVEDISGAQIRINGLSFSKVTY